MLKTTAVGVSNVRPPRAETALQVVSKRRRRDYINASAVVNTRKGANDDLEV